MKYCNPIPTVDIIIELSSGIVLIKRKNPPYGWAIPGGFIDYVVFTAKGTPKASDDATAIAIFIENNLPDEIAFDHRKILEDYFKKRY